MKKLFKLAVTSLTLLLAFSCATSLNNSSNSFGVINNNINADIKIEVHCKNCYVSNDRTNWSKDLEYIYQSSGTGKLAIDFRKSIGYDLPSGPLSVKRFNGTSYDDIAYEYMKESSIEGGYKLDTLFIDETYLTNNILIEIAATKDCVKAYLDATYDNEEVGFSYNGGLECVDWGDGTVNKLTTHTYATRGSYSIKLSGSITSISFGTNDPTSNAFKDGNRDIYRIDIKNTVKSIPTGSFSNLTKLQELSIPSSVERIAPGAFIKCKNLNDIEIDENNETFKTTNNKNIIDDTDGTLIYASTEEPLPDDITDIGESAYEGSDVTEVSLPEDVVEIGENAFKDCEQLKVLDLSNLNEVPEMNGDHIFDNVPDDFKIIISPDLYREGITEEPSWENYLDYVEWLPINMSSTHMDITSDTTYPYAGSPINFTVKLKDAYQDYQIPASNFRAEINDNGEDVLVDIVVNQTTRVGTFTYTPTDDCETLNVKADIFKITFSSEEGYFTSTTSTNIVKYFSLADVPSLSEIPLKDSDAYNKYTFTNWSPAPSKATSNTTYKARYSPTMKDEFTINWYDSKTDDTPFDTEIVPKLTMPSEHEAKYLPSDEQHHYRFAEWREIENDEVLTFATHDTSYYPYYVADDQLAIHFVGTNVVESVSGRSEFYEPTEFSATSGKSYVFTLVATAGSLADATLSVTYLHEEEGAPSYNWDSSTGKLTVNSPIKDDIEIIMEAH